VGTPAKRQNQHQPPDHSQDIPIRIVPCRFGQRCGNDCRHRQTVDGNEEPVLYPEMDCELRQRHTLQGNYVFVLASIIAAICGFLITSQITTRHGMDDLNAHGDLELRRAVSRLEREIDKFAVLPVALSIDKSVEEFFRNDGHNSGDAFEAMNRALARLNDAAGAKQVYLINPRGMVIASSNAHDKDSFVGRDLSYRPYFRDSNVGVVNRYYGIGTTANTPGYYLSTALEDHGRRLGVVVMKIGLEALERDWVNGTDQLVMLTDANKIVVLSSHEDWKYHSLGPIEPERLAQINETQQYNHHVTAQLVWREREHFANGGTTITAGTPDHARTYLADTSYVPSVAMTLTVLSDIEHVTNRARDQSIIAAVLVLLAALGLRHVNERRLANKERQLARDALQQAYNRLRQQFEERNHQLRTANEELRHEVDERIRAAKQLQSMQDELIRTENLAVIGQLSAGLVHEINQPLAALGTLSENAVRFLELQDLGTVHHNLQRINDLVGRMAVLTGQLRSFARRTDGEMGPVDVAHAIDSAVSLLAHRLKKEHKSIDIQKPDHPVLGLAETVRLEQVLVNLISNAMDAVHGNGEPHIAIEVQTQWDQVHVDVSDNGHGLSDTVLERLFEPFFTTKKTSGLGLGLAISQDIIRRFGGDLTASNQPTGGACFRITLRLVSSDDPASQENPHA
jgi:C4-dicarboxylate-specific signal transduction histidine kinase